MALLRLGCSGQAPRLAGTRGNETHDPHLQVPAGNNFTLLALAYERSHTDTALNA